ncbi:MAG: hypothetical protein KTR15_08565 [Phycisphaeraceae bacterium]|nr:hypothetical protein [Phycisphaeraceae bacterium]
MNSQRLSELFHEIKASYFPRWDRGGRWDAEFGTDEQLRGSTGYCDSKANRVYLRRHSINGMPRPGVRALIIHEICHEVGSAYHGKGWATRMQRARDRAIQLGELEVARILESDIFSYTGTKIG